jgi:hypothetical protein
MYVFLPRFVCLLFVMMLIVCHLPGFFATRRFHAHGPVLLGSRQEPARFAQLAEDSAVTANDKGADLPMFSAWRFLLCGGGQNERS